MKVRTCTNCGHDVIHAGERNPFMRGIWIHRATGSKYCDDSCLTQSAPERTHAQMQTMEGR